MTTKLSTVLDHVMSYGRRFGLDRARSSPSRLPNISRWLGLEALEARILLSSSTPNYLVTPSGSVGGNTGQSVTVGTGGVASLSNGTLYITGAGADDYLYEIQRNAAGDVTGLTTIGQVTEVNGGAALNIQALTADGANLLHAIGVNGASLVPTTNIGSQLAGGGIGSAPTGESDFTIVGLTATPQTGLISLSALNGGDGVTLEVGQVNFTITPSSLTPTTPLPLTNLGDGLDGGQGITITHALTNATPLSDLTNVTGGTLDMVLRDGSTMTVNLTGATTIANVISDIDAATSTSSATVTATDATGVLVLTDNSTPNGTSVFTVNGTAASGLGVNVADGSDADATVNGVIVGTPAFPVVNVALNPSGTVGQVLLAIDQASDNTVVATLGSNGSSFQLQDTTNVPDKNDNPLMVLDSPAAEGLGLNYSAGGVTNVNVTYNSTTGILQGDSAPRTPFPVVLGAGVTTISQVISAINSVGNNVITAGVNAANTGISITDNSFAGTPTTGLTVTPMNGSTVAQSLGVAGTWTGSTWTGTAPGQDGGNADTDALLNGTLTGQVIAGNETAYALDANGTTYTLYALQLNSGTGAVVSFTPVGGAGHYITTTDDTTGQLVPVLGFQALQANPTIPSTVLYGIGTPANQLVPQSYYGNVGDSYNATAITSTPGALAEITADEPDDQTFFVNYEDEYTTSTGNPQYTLDQVTHDPTTPAVLDTTDNGVLTASSSTTGTGPGDLDFVNTLASQPATTANPDGVLNTLALGQGYPLVPNLPVQGDLGGVRDVLDIKAGDVVPGNSSLNTLYAIVANGATTYLYQIDQTTTSTTDVEGVPGAGAMIELGQLQDAAGQPIYFVQALANDPNSANTFFVVGSTDPTGRSPMFLYQIQAPPHVATNYTPTPLLATGQWIVSNGSTTLNGVVTGLAYESGGLDLWNTVTIPAGPGSDGIPDTNRLLAVADAPGGGQEVISIELNEYGRPGGFAPINPEGFFFEEGTLPAGVTIAGMDVRDVPGDFASPLVGIEGALGSADREIVEIGKGSNTGVPSTAPLSITDEGPADPYLRGLTFANTPFYGERVQPYSVRGDTALSVNDQLWTWFDTSDAYSVNPTTAAATTITGLLFNDDDPLQAPTTQPFTTQELDEWQVRPEKMGDTAALDELAPGETQGPYFVGLAISTTPSGVTTQWGVLLDPANAGDDYTQTEYLVTYNPADAQETTIDGGNTYNLTQVTVIGAIDVNGGSPAATNINAITFTRDGELIGWDNIDGVNQLVDIDSSNPSLTLIVDDPTEVADLTGDTTQDPSGLTTDPLGRFLSLYPTLTTSGLGGIIPSNDGINGEGADPNNVAGQTNQSVGTISNVPGGAGNENVVGLAASNIIDPVTSEPLFFAANQNSTEVSSSDPYPYYTYDLYGFEPSIPNDEPLVAPSPTTSTTTDLGTIHTLGPEGTTEYLTDISTLAAGADGTLYTAAFNTTAPVPTGPIDSLGGEPTNAVAETSNPSGTDAWVVSGTSGDYSLWEMTISDNQVTTSTAVNAGPLELSPGPPPALITDVTSMSYAGGNVEIIGYCPLVFGGDAAIFTYSATGALLGANLLDEPLTDATGSPGSGGVEIAAGVTDSGGTSLGGTPLTALGTGTGSGLTITDAINDTFANTLGALNGTTGSPLAGLNNGLVGIDAADGKQFTITQSGIVGATASGDLVGLAGAGGLAINPSSADFNLELGLTGTTLLSQLNSFAGVMQVVGDNFSITPSALSFATPLADIDLGNGLDGGTSITVTQAITPTTPLSDITGWSGSGETLDLTLGDGSTMDLSLPGSSSTIGDVINAINADSSSPSGAKVTASDTTGVLTLKDDSGGNTVTFGATGAAAALLGVSGVAPIGGVIDGNPVFNSYPVSLTGYTTLGQVVNAIYQQTGDRVSASLVNVTGVAGQIQLSVNSGLNDLSNDPLIVLDSPAAEALGLNYTTGAPTAATVNPTLTWLSGNSVLDGNPGTNGLNAPRAVFQVPLNGAVTINDVLNAINGAGGKVITAALNASSTGINITDASWTSSSTVGLTVTPENGTTVAQSLGLAGTWSNGTWTGSTPGQDGGNDDTDGVIGPNGVLAGEAVSGETVGISIAQGLSDRGLPAFSATTSVADILEAIDAASDPDYNVLSGDPATANGAPEFPTLSATLNPTGAGIILTSTAYDSPASFTIVPVNGSLAADDLGITGASTSAGVLTGANLLKTWTINFHQGNNPSNPVDETVQQLESAVASATATTYRPDGMITLAVDAALSALTVTDHSFAGIPAGPGALALTVANAVGSTAATDLGIAAADGGAGDNDKIENGVIVGGTINEQFNITTLGVTQLGPAMPTSDTTSLEYAVATQTYGEITMTTDAFTSAVTVTDHTNSGLALVPLTVNNFGDAAAGLASNLNIAAVDGGTGDTDKAVNGQIVGATLTAKFIVEVGGTIGEDITDISTGTDGLFTLSINEATTAPDDVVAGAGLILTDDAWEPSPVILTVTNADLNDAATFLGIDGTDGDLPANYVDGGDIDGTAYVNGAPNGDIVGGAISFVAETPVPGTTITFPALGLLNSTLYGIESSVPGGQSLIIINYNSELGAVGSFTTVGATGTTDITGLVQLSGDRLGAIDYEPTLFPAPDAYGIFLMQFNSPTTNPSSWTPLTSITGLGVDTDYPVGRGFSSTMVGISTAGDGRVYSFNNAAGINNGLWVSGDELYALISPATYSNDELDTSGGASAVYITPLVVSGNQAVLPVVTNPLTDVIATPAVTGLSFDPSNGTLYAIVNTLDATLGTPQLATFSRATGGTSGTITGNNDYNLLGTDLSAQGIVVEGFGGTLSVQAIQFTSTSILLGYAGGDNQFIEINTSDAGDSIEQMEPETNPGPVDEVEYANAHLVGLTADGGGRFYSIYQDNNTDTYQIWMGVPDQLYISPSNQVLYTISTTTSGDSVQYATPVGTLEDTSEALELPVADIFTSLAFGPPGSTLDGNSIAGDLFATAMDVRDGDAEMLVEISLTPDDGLLTFTRVGQVVNGIGNSGHIEIDGTTNVDITALVITPTGEFLGTDQLTGAQSMVAINPDNASESVFVSGEDSTQGLAGLMMDSDGNLYSIDTPAPGAVEQVFYARPTLNLFSISPSTGEATSQGVLEETQLPWPSVATGTIELWDNTSGTTNLPYSNAYTVAAYSPDGTLYAVFHSSSVNGDQLETIVASDGSLVASPVGSATGTIQVDGVDTYLSGMAFGIDGDLVGLDTQGVSDQVVIINTTAPGDSSVRTDDQDNPAPNTDLAGLTFNPADGRFYAVFPDSQGELGATSPYYDQLWASPALFTYDHTYDDNEGDTLIVTALGTLPGAAGDLGVLGYDSGPAGTTLSIYGATTNTPLVLTTSAGGTITLNVDGSFTYTPPSPTFLGTDTFTYRASDGTSVSALTTVTLDVESFNQPPIITVPPAQTVDENNPLYFLTSQANVISVADPDPIIGSLTISLTAVNGTMTLATTAGLTFTSGTGTDDTIDSFTAVGQNAPSLIDAALNGMVFNPTHGFAGTGSITITATDSDPGVGGPMTSSATVAITVLAFNNPPTLTEIAVLPTPTTYTPSNTPYTISYNTLFDASNLSDLDEPSNEVLSFVIESVTSGTLTQNGTAVLPGTTLLSPNAPDNTLVWTPANDATGTLNAFTVEGFDGNKFSGTPVQVEVNVENQPTAVVTGASDTAIPDGTTTTSAAAGTNFGTVIQQSPTVDETYTISDTGTAPLTVGTVTLPTGFTLVSAPAGSVGVGDSTTFTVGLTTGTAGTFSGNVSIATNDPVNNPYVFAITGAVTPTTTASVTGNGETIADGASPPITSNGTDFGAVIVGGHEVENSFTINNVGGATLEVNDLTVPAPFVVVQAPASTINAGSSSVFTIGLPTGVAGTYTGNVSFNTNDPQHNPYTFAIGGVVTTPVAVVSYDATTIADGSSSTSTTNGTAFTTVDLGAPTEDETFTITNNGITTDGGIALTLGGVSLPKGFTLITAPVSPVAPGDSTTFTVGLTTGTAGTFSGNVSIITNDPNNNPYVFAITGTVSSTSTTAATAAVSYNTNGIASGTTSTSTITGTDFGSVNEDASTVTSRTYTLANTGNATLTVSSINLPTGFFLVSPSGAINVAPDTSTTFTIGLGTSVPGTFSGNVSIVSNDSASPYTFAVTGTVNGAPVASVSYTANGDSIGDGSGTPSTTNGTDFGSVAQGGTSPTETYTITDIGTLALTIGQISLPSGFVMVTAPAAGVSPNAPNNTTTFTVGLSTGTAGTYSGDISIASNDPSHNPYEFAITGTVTGTTPTAAVSGNDQSIADGSTSPSTANATNFGSVAENGGPVDEIYTIANTGSGTLTIGTVSLPSGFSLVSSPASSVTAGGTTTFTVGLGTATAGTFSGSISIVTNDPNNNPYAFDITGTVSTSGGTGGNTSGSQAPSASVKGDGQAVADGATSTSAANGTNFGSAAQGASAIDQTFTISDTGTGTLSVGAVRLPTGFTLVSAPGASVQPGGSTSFTVALDTAAAGSFSGVVSFATNDPANDPYTFTIAGTVTVPTASVSGDAQVIADGSTTTSTANGTSFGSVALGTAGVETTFTIADTGTGTLTLGAVGLPSGFTLLSAPATSVAAGSSTTFTVGLTTASAGTFSGAVSIVTNDPANDPYTFEVAGTVTAPAASVSSGGQTVAAGSTTASSTNGTGFGSVARGAASVDHAFTITDNGNGTLTLGAVTLPDGFTLVTAPAASVSPGASTTLTIALPTATAGTFAGTVSIVTNTPTNNPFTFQVSGTVTAPAASITGDGQGISDGSTAATTANATSFGSVAMGAAAVDQTFTVANAGNGTLTLGTVTLPAGFTLVAAPGASVAPGASTTFTVGLTTGTAGTFSGTVSLVTNDSANNPYTFKITGTVTAPAPTLSGAGQAITDGSVTPSAANATDFGSVALGAAPVDNTFTIANAGNGTLTLGTINLPDGFTLVTAPTASVAPNASTTFTVGLATSAAGTFSGTVSVVTNDPAANPISFTISGTVTAAAASLSSAGQVIPSGSTGTSTANATDFGSVALGAGAVDQTFTIANTGNGTLTLGAVNLPGGFSLVSAPAASVAPGNSTTFTLALDTGNAGTFAGTVSLVTNDPSSNPYTFQVSGTVTAALASVTGNGQAVVGGATTTSADNATDFGSAAKGAPSVDHTFTIANNGNVALTLGAPVLPSGFTLVSAPGTSVPAGGTTTFTIGLPTTAAGSFGGTVSIATNDPGNNPYTFAITGTVTLMPATATVAALSTSASAVKGSTLTLTATGVTVPLPGKIKSVLFYSSTSTTFSPSTAKLVGLGKAAGAGTYTVTVSTKALPVGTETFFARAMDSYGRYGVAVNTTATITDAPPQVAHLVIVSPAHPAADNTVTLKATGVADPFNTVTSVSFYWDPSGTGTLGDAVLLGTATAKQGWTITATLPSATAATNPFPLTGNAVFIAQGVDKSGTEGNLADATVSVASQPTVAQMTASPEPVVRSQAATFTASGVTDSGGTVTKVQFWLAPAGATALDTIADTLLGQGTSQGGGTWALNLKNLKKLAAGTYELFARAMDSNGNWSEVAGDTVTLV